MLHYKHVCDDYNRDTDIGEWIMSGNIDSVRYRQKVHTENGVDGVVISLFFGVVSGVFTEPWVGVVTFAASTGISLSSCPPNTYVECDMIVTDKNGREFEYTYETVGNPNPSGTDYRSSESIIYCGSDGTVNGVQINPYPYGPPPPRVYDHDDIEFYHLPDNMKYQP